MKVNDSVLKSLSKSDKCRELEKLGVTVTAVTEEGID